MTAGGAYELIVGDGRLPVFVVGFLSWTVEDVGNEAQVYGADGGRVLVPRLFEQCHIGFLNGVGGKLLLKVALGLARLGKQEQAAGVHVETVHGSEFAELRKLVFCCGDGRQR